MRKIGEAISKWPQCFAVRKTRCDSKEEICESFGNIWKKLPAEFSQNMVKNIQKLPSSKISLFCRIRRKADD